MARGITEDDVHGAADALVAEGERPTVERIRAHLGTGSPNTVVRWLETWWRQLGTRLERAEAHQSLPDAPEAVAALAGRWWAAALEHAKTAAEADVVAAREALDLQRAQVEQDRQAFADEAAALRQQRGEALQARDLAYARSDELERLVGQLQVQIDEASRQHAAAEGRASGAEDERRAAEVRLHALQAQIATERDTLTQHVQAVEDRAHTEVDAARQEAREHKRKLAELARQHAAVDADYRQQLATIRNESSAALRDAPAQRARAEALETQLAHLRDLPAALESALQRATTKAKPKKATKRAKVPSKPSSPS